MLTYLGLTPDAAMDPDWAIYDVADLGLGQWVLIESRYNEVSQKLFRATGVYKFGKWSKPIAPAVWNDTLTGGNNRDARYKWRAPNIAENPQGEPLPPQDQTPLPSADWRDVGIDEIRYLGPMTAHVSFGPEGGPGSFMFGDEWNVLDGSPTRWAAVNVVAKMSLSGNRATPVSAGIMVNGKYFDCPSWKPWSIGTVSSGYLAPAWTNSGGIWYMSSWTAPFGTTSYTLGAVEIGTGSRYAVALAVYNEELPGGGSHQITDVCVADRSKGTAKSAKWDGHAFAGPLVKGNSAIFYGVPNIVDASESHPVVRVIMDLVAGTFKTEPCPDDQHSGSGMYAPSYMSDVPRIIALASEGSGGGPHRLAMDNDVIEILSSSSYISYSGNNILMRPYIAPSRFQGESVPGGYVEVAVWSPDSNLAGGDDRPRGYFL